MESLPSLVLLEVGETAAEPAIEVSFGLDKGSSEVWLGEVAVWCRLAVVEASWLSLVVFSRGAAEA